MTRTFKVEITETTPGCIPSHPMTIEAPADNVSALIQSLAALPLFGRDGVDFVPLSRKKSLWGGYQTHWGLPNSITHLK